MTVLLIGRFLCSTGNIGVAFAIGIEFGLRQVF